MANTTHAVEGAAGKAAEVLSHGAGQPEAVGMPQLNFAHFPNQIFWLVIALGAIYYILSRIALPRIAAILANRKDVITSDLTAAEAMKQKAREAEAAYEKALADARVESSRIIGVAKAEIQAELDVAIAKADAEIAARAAEAEKAISEMRAGAAESVAAVAKDTAVELVSALGGRADASVVADAVDARLKG